MFRMVMSTIFLKNNSSRKMSSSNGNIIVRFFAIALFFLLISAQRAECQQSILDSAFTFRAGSVKTGNALDIISRQTGYNFTYDSRLIDQEKKTTLSFKNTRLRGGTRQSSEKRFTCFFQLLTSLL